MDRDLAGIEPCDLRRRFLNTAAERRPALVLGRSPDGAFARFDVGRCVHRLHASMSQIGRVIFGGDHATPGQRAGADTLGDDAAPARELRGVLPHHLAGEFGRGALVPLDRQCIAAFACGPVSLGDDGDSAGHPDDMTDPRHCLRRFLVPLDGTSTEDRTAGDHGHQSILRTGVDTEYGTPVDLPRQIEARHRLSDDRPLLRWLRDNARRHGQRRGGLGQLTIRKPTTAGRVKNHAVLGPTFRGVDPPGVRRGLNQHRSRGGSGLAQRLPGGAHAGAASGDLRRENRVEIHLVGRRLFDEDAVPRDIQLLGKQLRKRRRDALTHLRSIDQEEHRSVGTNPDPCVRLERRGDFPALPRGTAGEVDGDREPGTRRSAGPKEIPAGNMGGHVVTSPAAR